MNITKTIIAFSILMLSSLSAIGAPTNLVHNGSFELGHVDFTSDYFRNTIPYDGQYQIAKDPASLNGNFGSVGDHTTGTGNMFIGNGHSVAGKIVWESHSISVLANTSYAFEAWAMNVCCKPSEAFPNPASTNPASLRFDVVIGSTIDTLGYLDTNLNDGIWDLFRTNWSSATNTSITLRITDTNTEIQGNDFAIDDIRFLAPVPEPETYAMLLVGLGLLGFMAFCRKEAIV